MVVADRPITRKALDLVPERSLEERIADLDLDQLAVLFRERWGGLETLGHKTHTTAYDIGLVLERVRSQCLRGSWLEWVDTKADISRTTAWRYIKFRELVGERSNLEQLQGEWGIAEAIAHLTPQRQPGPEDESHLTPVATPREISIEQLDAGRLTEHQLRRWRGQVDLVCTSWPYGLQKSKAGYVDYADYDELLDAAANWVETLGEVLAPQGRVCLVVPFDTRLGGTPRPLAADLIAEFVEGRGVAAGFKYRQHHIWTKSPGGQTSRSTARGSAAPPIPTPNAPAALTGAEEILVFHRGEWSLGRTGEHSDLEPDEALHWTNAYWDDVSGESDAAYPCVFPDELAARLIKLYSFPRKASGERSIVADFHLGRGTTARASMRLGRAFVGGDLNPTAVALATRNVQAAYLEMTGVAA